MNLFEQATRNKLRFFSAKGELTTEQLWDLPLQSRTQFDLDTVAKAVNHDLKQLSEESFVDDGKTNPNKALWELKLAVVVHIIQTKKAENQAKTDALAKAQEAEVLQSLLATKKAAKLEQLTEEEIEARLNSLKK